MYLTKLLVCWLIVDLVTGADETSPVPLKLKRHYLKKFYLPATIQILSHINDNLKFVLRPFVAQAASDESSLSSLSLSSSALTSNRRQQTSTHRPGIVSPFRLQYRSDDDDEQPQPQPQPQSSTNSTNNYTKIIFDLKELENRLMNGTDEHGDREFDTVLKFLASFDDRPDDANFLRKNRQNSLVRAYVTLVSLFDLLTKESRRNSLQKSQGYSDDSVRQLNQLSQAGTSAEQLETILRKLLEMDEIKSQNLMMKIAKTIHELNSNNSQNYLTHSVRTIPPLRFIP